MYEKVGLMSDIPELERRLTAAMDRIASGLDGVQNKGQDGWDEVSRLKQALETEKNDKAELAAQVEKLNTEHSKQTAALQDELKVAQAALEILDREVQDLKATSESLRNNVSALRDANKEGVGNPELINASLEAELAALQAERTADKAELTAVKSLLEPLLQTETQMGEQEDA